MHVPVMLKEVVTALAVQPGGRYIDATLGAGGHASAILRQSFPGGQLLGIDADPKAIAIAGKKLAAFEGAAMLVNDHFTNLKDICTRYDFSPVHGILLDLGLSSMQLSVGGSGFSFQHDAPLDMRFSPDQEVSAADIVNQYSEGQLESIIRTYGEERQSRQIARSIIQKRPIATTVGLAEVVTDAVGGRHGRIHPATRTFQALRVAVNRELEQLESVLSQAISLLGFEGRLVVISYHSLEDRIVKRFMQREARNCICPADIPVCVCSHQAKVKLVSRRIIAPGTDEVRRNPRSRSARLRVAERISERENSFADYLNVMAETDDSYVWKRPVMMEKVRRAFMALQVENIRIV